MNEFDAVKKARLLAPDHWFERFRTSEDWKQVDKLRDKIAVALADAYAEGHTEGMAAKRASERRKS